METCYTILNVQDSEPYNELQIKQNLGKNFTKKKKLHTSSCFP